jgi:hypothetical protein
MLIIVAERSILTSCTINILRKTQETTNMIMTQVEMSITQVEVEMVLTLPTTMILGRGVIILD